MKQLLLAAGAVTVVRGYVIPPEGEESFPESLLPLISYWQDRPERLKPGADQNTIVMEGEIGLHLIVPTPAVSGVFGNEEAAWLVIDTLKDAVLRTLQQEYLTYFSQTTRVFYDGVWEPYYFFKPPNGLRMAELRLGYAMNFA